MCAYHYARQQYTTQHQTSDTLSSYPPVIIAQTLSIAWDKTSNMKLHKLNDEHLC